MKKNIYYIITITLLLLFILSNHSYCLGDPKLISTLNSAFEKIENWMIKLATPAAAIAVISGAFMKKFSFGDEEKIRIGKKLIKSSLFSYAFILVINLILSAIESLLS